MECPQGATFDKTFTVTDAGGVVNWTGYSGKLQVRRYADLTKTAVLTLTTSGGGITNLTNDGKIILTVTPTQTAAIVAGNYVYDLELTQGTYKVRLLSGRFTVTPQVTD